MMSKLENMAIIMNPDLDQVAVAKKDIPEGFTLEYNGSNIKTKGNIKAGHRLALTDIKKGDYIKQYGYPFGQSKGISKGELITVSNIENVIPEINLSDFKSPNKTEFNEKYLDKTFKGYIRKNGQVGTRNYYLVVPTSMCVSETALQIAKELDDNQELLKDYPNIDGIVAIANTEGCGCDSGEQIDRFMLVLKGFINHPNVGGCLIIDLGCEQTNYHKMHTYLKATLEQDLKPIDWITVQESGGTRLTTKKAIDIINSRLNEVNQVQREFCSISHLIVGTECGGSDSFSGITANPVIGNTVDKVVFGDGSAILTEIPELTGTFEMILSRFRTLEIANKFKQIIEWYIQFAKKLGLTLKDNLVEKNIKGGLINNYIKNLGTVMKGGTTAIEDVIQYAEPLKKKGLNIMQGPGGDLESVTGLSASGATVICFSTGRGTTTGSAISPVIKISSNDSTYNKLKEDIDFNAGRLISEKTSIDILGEELLDKVITVSSGDKTWSEKWKQRQFQVWTAGKLPL